MKYGYLFLLILQGCVPAAGSNNSLEGVKLSSIAFLVAMASLFYAISVHKAGYKAVSDAARELTMKAVDVERIIAKNVKLWENMEKRVKEIEEEIRQIKKNQNTNL